MNKKIINAIITASGACLSIIGWSILINQNRTSYSNYLILGILFGAALVLSIVGLVYTIVK